MASSFLSSDSAVELVRGTSSTLQLTVTTPAGVPIDLTGARVVFTVKCSISDDSPVLRKDSLVGPGEIEITSALAGEVNIYLEPADSQTLRVGKYVFDVWVVLASGARYVVVGPSSFQITPAVTVLS